MCARWAMQALETLGVVLTPAQPVGTPAPPSLPAAVEELANQVSAIDLLRTP